MPTLPICVLPLVSKLPNGMESPGHKARQGTTSWEGGEPGARQHACQGVLPRPGQEALGKWRHLMACWVHHSLRTVAWNAFPTAYHQGLRWKWPNKTLPQAWPASNQFNLELSVQTTGAQLVHYPLYLFFFLVISFYKICFLFYASFRTLFYG